MPEPSSNPRLDIVYRKRTPQVDASKSSIVIREDEWKENERIDEVETRKLNRREVNEIQDLPDYRHTILDYSKVIFALHKLGYFCKFDGTIDARNNGPSDLSRQKNATLKETMETFGRAVNIEGFGTKYNNEFARQFGTYIDNGKLVSKEDFLEIFERMKRVMEFEYDERINKKSSSI